MTEQKYEEKQRSCRRTTTQQRKFLFEVWKATGNISLACQKANVGRGTFYYWKHHFDKYGFIGLERLESFASQRSTHQKASKDKKGNKTTEKILQAIKDFWAEHGFSTSVRDIQIKASISSTSVVNYHLKILENQKKICRQLNIARSIVVL